MMFSDERKTEKNEYDDILADFSLSRDIDIDKNTLLVIEDIDNKQWVLYSSYTGEYGIRPFGYVVSQVIHEYLSGTANDVHHDKLIKWYDEIGTSYDEEYMKKSTEYLKPSILKLQNVILNMERYRKDEHKAEMKAALLKTWKMYRNTKNMPVWKTIIELATSTAEDYNEIREFTENDIEKLVKSNHEEAVEIERTMYKIHTEEYFCFCDYVTLYDKNGVPLTGRGYIARTFGDIFASDLYHVLVSGLAAIPRLCPRCNHIFYAQNKAKYCSECREDSSTIRNEKRRNSVRYYHKKVYDKINQSKKYDDDFRNSFLNESNYYWDMINGKEVIPNPLYRERIKTEAQYMKWLEKKLNSL